MMQFRNQICITISKDRIKFAKDGSNDFYWIDNVISSERIAIRSVEEASKVFKKAFKEHFNSLFPPHIKLILDIEYEGGLTDLEIQAFKQSLLSAGTSNVLIEVKKNPA